MNSGARYANRKPVSDADYVNERVSDADYVNPKITPDADYANERITPDADYANKAIIFGRKNEETESVDTEGLIIKPPMPLFDASPSLTTESAESSGESEDTLIENLALRTSFLATDKSDSELRSSSETQSYLQLPESLRERRIPETRQDWEREDSTRYVVGDSRENRFRTDRPIHSMFCIYLFLELKLNLELLRRFLKIA